MSVAMVLNKIKSLAKGHDKTNDLIEVFLDFKFDNVANGLVLPIEVGKLAEKSYFVILDYLKNRGAIENVTHLNEGQFDCAVQLYANNFNDFYTETMFLVMPFIDSSMDHTFKNLPEHPPNTTSKSKLPEIIFTLGEDFAVHKQNIISYKRHAIELEPQVARIVVEIMERSRTNSFTSATHLAANVLGSYEYKSPETYITKAISEARKIFKTATKTDTNFFENKSGIGYRFNY